MMTSGIFGALRRATVGVAAAAGLAPSLAGAVPFPVTTYHYDTLLSGWNSQETALTPATVGSSSFGLLSTVALDNIVFAQPMVIPKQVVQGDPNPGTHDVVYVVTYSNTVYAIDPTRGTVLASRSLGATAPNPCYPHEASGVNSSPVIDRAAELMYVITYETTSTGPQFLLHAIRLGSLADAMPPVVVSATQKLTNGTAYTFNPLDTRSRAALVESNGVIYAGFAGSCEGQNTATGRSRGWLLGWNASTLAQVPLNILTDRDATAPNSFFHTSIWMSGSGVAADEKGFLYFLTGNSDQSGTTYSLKVNQSESAVKVDPVANKIAEVFTPEEVAHWDQIDLDFGSGGIMLLPPVAGAPRMAAAAGKSGTLYLLDRDKLGGFTAGGPDKVLGEYDVTKNCYCVATDFVGSDGNTYLLIGSGQAISMFQVQAKPAPALALVKTSQTLPPSQQGPRGYFTTMSSNGSASPIAWVVSRNPSFTNLGYNIYAFNADPTIQGTGLPLLYTAQVGTWNYKLDINATPVVSNGFVYVAGDHQLAIYGLSGTSAKRGN